MSSISRSRSFGAATAGLSTLELGLLLATAGLGLCALMLPPLAQDPAYHRFADARTLLGVPNALDVISNLGFLVAGLYGLHEVASNRLHLFSTALKAGVFVTFIGFVATAIGSAAYHLAPADGGLVADRLGMVVAFAGVLGMAAAQRVSSRAGFALLGAALVLGPCAVIAWSMLGTLTPYAVMQFGGIALLVGLLTAPALGPGPNWRWLVAAYLAAKVFEGADAFVWDLTGHLVSGHTLKHLVAALPVLAVTMALDIKGG